MQPGGHRFEPGILHQLRPPGPTQRRALAGEPARAEADVGWQAKFERRRSRAEAASAAKTGDNRGSFSTEYPANGSFRPQSPAGAGVSQRRRTTHAVCEGELTYEVLSSWSLVLGGVLVLGALEAAPSQHTRHEARRTLQEPSTKN